ncbi:mannosyl-oligosaccharide alpha-1,2-mannosidase [Exophiala dermatitidis]|uniref:alpha-1,2-Mannosidase n=2 Tax=Exophiala dermatitidis TaxID=5970 RepID=H6BLK4_EXODN|nr:mannosyl-oligosaccharide alpha-1,2-mannosidase [Exophiala dermatitidis NIH/UT8656]KAJ4504411.1 mannosyl-oligosaccharide alpha-1,2-mannosidase [Exophiala dermatitidis]EHY51897.1 mannosyl-oligosaccharide alpha-1,2-mannosidase [Exophiala dermatitidis NIH/UT8656]KAJ4505998.1 mannosyl-oligosaccharide alpha-1,2-mannosidase [Exophiala dermatitidis]KAJ4506415.1 mannosyl-oligosaccharide alpha-1,2-mannosidase [Exophiala dermatitidis]KAJ4533590.1 mannosyl-oligosaccharide alpha-1,2-mannosidase [Exophia
MSFSVPQNVPEFTSTQRSYEDTYWRHKQSNGHTKEGTLGGVASKIHDIFGEHRGQDLPMYKDKPNFPSRRRRGMLDRKRIMGVVGFVTILSFWWLGWLPWSSRTVYDAAAHQHTFFDQGDWSDQREAVKKVFQTTWAGYEKYAWGMDEYHPLSRKGKNMVQGGMGWIIVDALDTAMMMNLTSEVAKAREWISTSLSYNADHDVNTFETTIRMLGGLLSAYYISTNFPHLAPQRDDDINQPGEDLYIEKATDLADRLLGAYDSPSGIPYASINLNTSRGIISHLDGGASSTAEAATLQLEMKYLSKITGEPVYWQQAEKVMEAIDAQHPQDGLVPIFIYPSTGQFRGENIRLGSRGDSYYEYLIKQYLQTGGVENVYLDMWEEALAGVKKHLVTYSKHASLTILAERQNGLSMPLTPKMDHLVCFMPGTIALAVTEGQSVQEAKARLGDKWTKKHDEDLKLAEELMKTCWGMYKVTPTGLAPEISYFRTDTPPRQWQGHVDPDWSPPQSSPLSDDPDADWRLDYDIHSNDVHNLQRPETVESLFYMYRITKDPKYRQWGWEMFEAFREHTKVVDEVTGEVYAYTSLYTVMENPVKNRKKRDNMESFWLAETLKYFYLLFSDDDFFPLDKVVYNTEAHPLPKFDISGSKVFKTGWQRGKDAPRPATPGDNRIRKGATRENEAIRVGDGVRFDDTGKRVEIEVARVGEVQAPVAQAPVHDHDDTVEHGHIEESGKGIPAAEHSNLENLKEGLAK